MKFRSAIAALALASVALVGVAACSDSKKDDNASSTSTTSSAPASASSEVATDLTTDQATKLIRTVLDPKTSASDKSAAIDGPAGLGEAAQGVATGFNAAGYTADLFTATKVSGTGTDAAQATINVKGPHGTADMTVKYVKKDGNWKLSADVLSILQQAAGGH
ncbi:hypothetical protein [Jongsikchunia kroppenstedtii]|uniref:hypothetical protein n=1 Tax=Jongsikchunia kroppenstedtii TaxID=1121721 RepID=UPI000362349F|nr:hypothetical protein [Jongsikchunia kroppenstedtii]